METELFPRKNAEMKIPSLRQTSVRTVLVGSCYLFLIA